MAKVFDLDLRKWTLIDSIGKLVFANTWSCKFSNSEIWKAVGFNWTDQVIKYDVSQFRWSDNVWTVITWVKFNVQPVSLSRNLVTSSDTATSTRVLSFCRYDLSTWKLSALANNAWTTDIVLADTVIQIWKRYQFVVSSNGSAWSMWLNWQQQTLTVSWWANSWKRFNDVLNRDNFALWCLYTSTPIYAPWTIARVQIFDNVLTQAEINKDYQDFLKSSSQELLKRNFRDSSVEINANETGLVASYQFAGVNANKTIAVKGNNLTQTGSIFMEKNWAYSPAKWSYLTWWNLWATVYAFEIVLASNLIISNTQADHRVPIAFSSWYDYNGLVLGSFTWLVTNEIISLAFLDWATQYRTSWAGTDVIPAWTELHIFCNWNWSNYDMWINGEKKTVTSGSVAHVPLYTASAFTLFSDSKHTGTTYDFTGSIKKVRIFNSAKTDAYVSRQYQDYAKQVYLNETLEGNGADWVVCNPKERTVTSGTWKISEDTTVTSWLRNIGDKYITDATIWWITLPINFWYWTLEFDFYKSDASECYVILWDTYGWRDATWQDWYYFYLNSVERFMFGKSTNWSPSTALYTSSWFYAQSTWYRFRITRTIGWVWTFYIKWWAFWINWWTLISPMELWTNPYTDNTFTSLTKLNFFTTWAAWNRIWNIRYYQWVLPN